MISTKLFNMKHIFFSVILSIGLILGYSCNKEKLEVPESSINDYPNYSQLAEGNYWVYERYELDTNGNETALGQIDTIFIEKDTLIESVRFFKRVTHNFDGSKNSAFLRDSLSCLVSHQGVIIFSSSIFNEYLFIDTTGVEYDIKSRMIDKDLQVTVPAGTYITSCFQNIFDYKPPLHPDEKQFVFNSRYSENVGLVYQEIYQSTVSYTIGIRKLIDFHIEE